MDDFNFYMKLAKPLALNLHDARDRTMAARWLKKLREIDESATETSDKIHVEYLKLLLFAMQANRLDGIFAEPPPDGDLQKVLQPAANEQRKKAKDMIALTKGRRTSSSEQSKPIRRDNLPVNRSISGDMCEYVAVQEIPNFGIHGFYALSTEPLSRWNPPNFPITADVKTSTVPVLKTAPKKAASEPGGDSRNSEETFHDAIGESRPKTVDGSAKKTARVALSTVEERSILNCGKGKDDGERMKKMLEARKKEIASVGTRPSWGTNRYIDRLIDESPHVVGDLDLSEADALLHVYRESKMRKMKTGKEPSKACAISSRRKQVEMKLDMPPCASIPVDDDKWETQRSRTCLPRKNYLDRLTDQQSCCIKVENNGSFSSYPSGASVTSSLRGGGGGSNDSRFYLGGEFQYNRTYESLRRDCTDDPQDNVTDDWETND